MAYLREVDVPPDLVVIDTTLREVPSCAVATAAGHRGVRVVPLASDRFNALGGADASGGFDVAGVVRRVEESLSYALGRPARVLTSS